MMEKLPAGEVAERPSPAPRLLRRPVSKAVRDLAARMAVAATASSGRTADTSSPGLPGSPGAPPP